MFFQGVITFLLLGITLSQAFPWTVPCFWTNTFNSTDPGVDLCNHVIFDPGDKVRLEQSTLSVRADDFTQTSGYKNLMRFKERHPKVKLELLIGSFATKKVLYDIAAKPQNFITAVRSFLKCLRFDGIHLMWGSPNKDAYEYFLTPQNATKQRKILSAFLMELKMAKVSFSFGIRGVLEIDCNMEVNKVYETADLVLLYAYAYHGAWEETTGAFSPLHAREESSERVNYFYMTVESTWESLEVSGGVPEKTILVVSAKSSLFKLRDPASHGIAAGSDRRKFKKEDNTRPDFKEVCRMLLDKNRAGKWSIVWDDVGKQSYTYSGDTWISYEDVCSVIEKKNYARDMKFAGMALKDLSRDDQRGDCVERTLPENADPHMVDNLKGTFPLLRIIAEIQKQTNPCSKILLKCDGGKTPIFVVAFMLGPFQMFLLYLPIPSNSFDFRPFNCSTSARAGIDTSRES